VKTLFFSALALIAFAANSVLCRLALGDELIDAAGFTIIRLLSGAVVLSVILTFSTNKNRSRSRGSWSASVMLFVYAITFSFAYISLDTGTGALILFGAVQITMILMALISGYRLHFSEWIGLALAFFGFVYLVLPGVTAPPLFSFALMTIAGIAWGLYTLKGKDSSNPLTDTAYNFLRTTPLAIILAIATLQNLQLSFEGILLAVLSGGIASGIGYTMWYIALAGLSATQAAVIQLLVPIIAALGGVIFVSEAITFRLAFAAVMILGGVLLVLLGRYYFVQKSQL